MSDNNTPPRGKFAYLRRRMGEEGIWITEQLNWSEFNEYSSASKAALYATPNAIPPEWYPEGMQVATQEFYDDIVEKQWDAYYETEAGGATANQREANFSAMQECAKNWNGNIESIKAATTNLRSQLVAVVGTDFQKTIEEKFPNSLSANQTRAVPLGSIWHSIAGDANAASNDSGYFWNQAGLATEDAAKLKAPNTPSIYDPDDEVKLVTLVVEQGAGGDDSANMTSATGQAQAYPSGWATLLSVVMWISDLVVEKGKITDEWETMGAAVTNWEEGAKAFAGLYDIYDHGVDDDGNSEKGYEGTYAGIDFDIPKPSSGVAAAMSTGVRPIPQPLTFVNYYTDSNNRFEGWHAQTYKRANNNRYNRARGTNVMTISHEQKKELRRSRSSTAGELLTYQPDLRSLLSKLDTAAQNLSPSNLTGNGFFDGVDPDIGNFTDSESTMLQAISSLLKAYHAQIAPRYEALKTMAHCLLQQAVVDLLIDAQEFAEFMANAGLDADKPSGWGETIFLRKIRQKQGRDQHERRAQNAGSTLQQVREIVDRRRTLIKEQCFLMNHADIFAKRKIMSDKTNTNGKKASKRLPYVHSDNNDKTAKTAGSSNATLLLNGDPYAFMNRLTLSPKLKHLMDIEGYELSALQPKIRLYKVVFDENGDDSFEVEVPFETNTTGRELQFFTKGQGSRGTGVGIKSFTFSYEGSNPFAVKKSIKGNLKIFANNMKELLNERTLKKSLPANGEHKFRYIDLALKTGNFGGKAKDQKMNCQDLEHQNITLQELNFRLKAEVGWAAAKKLPGDNSPILSSQLREALRESFVSLNLTPTVHNFEFDDQGRVTFNINYLAYIEQFFDTNKFNIFAGAKSATGKIAPRRIARNAAIETYSKSCGENSAEVVSALKEEFRDEIASENSNAFKKLTKDLIESNKMKYLTVPLGTVRAYARYRSNADARVLVHKWILNESALNIKDYESGQGSLTESELEEATKAYEEEANRDPSNPEEGAPEQDAVARAIFGAGTGNQLLTYFYVSDLIDMILANIESELDDLSEITTIQAGMTGFDLKSYGVANLNNPVAVSADRITEMAKEHKIALRNFQKLRILLGPMELRHTVPNEDGASPEDVSFINLGDIPVSIRYFVEFLTSKMLSKEESYYGLTKFLNEFFNTLVRDAFNSDNCGTALGQSQRIRVNQAAITAYSDSDTQDVVTGKIINTSPRGKRSAAKTTEFRANIKDLLSSEPILPVSGPHDSARTSVPLNNEFNYFVYSAGRTMPLEQMKGIRADDEEKGIFHYLLGRNKGLIKNIKLTKTQTKGLAEVRFEQDGYDGLQQLRVVYDVQIDTYCNVNTFPGTYLFVDPRGFAPNTPMFTGQGGSILDLTKLGVGGYYMIYRSEHNFMAGRADTTLYAKWVNAVDAAENCAQLTSDPVAPGASNASCKVFLDKRQKAAEEAQ